ncbi:IS30 family transposase [Candidatus Giovannonibacteria bacterium]|nr:IS30 family transposase [Candidatus Giovannonibacteria bacterium]
MNRSSISREINQNKDSDGIYRGGHAHKRAMERRKQGKAAFKKIGKDPKLRKYIIRKLKKYWSPEQIAGRLKRKYKTTVVCQETIYQFIYEEHPDLVKYLRRQKNKYRRKRGTKARMQWSKALKIRRIGERPGVVETRKRIGDWEGDTVVGKEKKQRILTYVERKSGFGMANKLDVVTAEIVQEKTAMRFRALRSKARRTLTRDNGPEFGDYDQDLEERTKMKVYRATPYRSCERGTNENWDGLLRQFFPKGMVFATITQYRVDQVVRLLNNRPRKRLDYATPRERFRECCNSD